MPVLTTCECGSADTRPHHPHRCLRCHTIDLETGRRPPAPAATVGVRQPAPPEPCDHFQELSGPERDRLRLGHVRGWGRCGLGLTLPRGTHVGIVCPCQGCGPACPGYASSE